MTFSDFCTFHYIVCFVALALIPQSDSVTFRLKNNIYLSRNKLNFHVFFPFRLVKTFLTDILHFVSKIIFQSQCTFYIIMLLIVMLKFPTFCIIVKVGNKKIHGNFRIIHLQSNKTFPPIRLYLVLLVGKHFF